MNHNFVKLKSAEYLTKQVAVNLDAKYNVKIKFGSEAELVACVKSGFLTFTSRSLQNILREKIRSSNKNILKVLAFFGEKYI